MVVSDPNDWCMTIFQLFILIFISLMCGLIGYEIKKLNDPPFIPSKTTVTSNSLSPRSPHPDSSLQQPTITTTTTIQQQQEQQQEQQQQEETEEQRYQEQQKKKKQRQRQQEKQRRQQYQYQQQQQQQQQHKQPPEKCLGILTTMHMFILSVFFIFCKEVLGSSDWIYFLIVGKYDRINSILILVTHLAFTLSLYFMQVLFIERMNMTLQNSAFQFHPFLYHWLRVMSVLIALIGIVLAYAESTESLLVRESTVSYSRFSRARNLTSASFIALCCTMCINTGSSIWLFYRALSQLLVRSSAKNNPISHLLVRLTLSSSLALVSTTMMSIAGAAVIGCCDPDSSISYIYYYLYPVDSSINISCLLFSVNFGEKYYYKVLGRIHHRLHDSWFGSPSIKDGAATP